MTKAPLRKIINRGVSPHGVPTETLECGHVVHGRVDAIGPTNAYRRRCRYCIKSRKTEGNAGEGGHTES
jgi:hypothetical protein